MLDHIETKVVTIINEQLRDMLLQNEINLDDRFEEVGINSISFIKFIVELEKEFRFKFEYEELDVNKYETLRDIVLFIKGKI